MANISSYTSLIASAIYGEEVRGSIINALNAMNNGINVDLSAMQTIEKNVTSYADQVSTHRTEAVNAANSAKTSETNAVNAANSAKTSETNAVNAANSAKTYSDSTNVKRADVERMYNIILDLMGSANYNNIYNFVREQIVKDEGYEVEVSIEDSSGNPILDSSGNPIMGRRFLDPVNFEDIFDYVLRQFMRNDILDMLFSLTFEAIKQEMYTFVLSSLTSDIGFKNDIYKMVLNNLYNEKPFWDEVFNTVNERTGTYEYDSDLLDSDGDQILDSNSSPIIGRTLFYIKK